MAGAAQLGLRVVHAWEHGKPVEALAAHADPDEIEAAVERRLRELVAQELGATDLLSGCGALRGPVTDALVKEAERVGAYLLVVGARGAGGALRALLGSVSRQLTECPTRAVAVVPDEDDVVPTSGATRIVVGVDGSDGAARALRWAGDAAQRSGAEVVVVHAFQPPADLLRGEEAAVTQEVHGRLDEEWCAPLRNLGVSYRPALERGDAREVIDRVAAREEPACVVLGSRGLGPVSQRLLGSVTHHVVRHLTRPTVIIPAPRDCPVWRI